MDYDGTSRFSAPISITNNGSGKLNLYPNPTTGDVLYIDGVENPNDIVMMNQFGQLVSNTAVSSISQNQVSMDVSQLRSGMYFIKDLNTLEQYKVIVP